VRFIAVLLLLVSGFSSHSLAQEFLACKLRGDGPSQSDFNPEFSAALRALGGDDLIASFGYVPKVKVIKSPAPNAFSLADGTILISSAMLNLVANQSELSFVIAHEISHKLLGHLRSEQAFLGTGASEKVLEQNELAADRLALKLFNAAKYELNAPGNVLRRASLERQWSAEESFKKSSLDARIRALGPDL